MKKLIVTIMILSLLLACVPTPEEEFVVNKSDGTLEDKLSSDPVAEFTTELNTQEVGRSPLYDVLGAPGRWTMETETRSVPFADLTIIADAEVVLPNVGKVSVYETAQWGFSEATLKAVADTLLGDGERYAFEEGFLKSEWEERIKRRQKRIEYIQAHPEQYEGWFEEALEDERELLSQMSEQYTNAPADYACTPWNGSYKNGCMTRVSEGVYAKLRVTGDRLIFHWTTMRSTPRGLYDYLPDKADGSAALEARTVAEAFMERAGLSEAYRIERVKGLLPAPELRENDDEISGYEITFLPMYSGITAAPYWTGHGSDTAQQAAIKKGLFEEPDYDAKIGPEYISLVVENGQIVYVDWSNHFECGECINENVPLLPFADIERVIKNAIFTEHFLDEGVNDTVRIVRIEFNMMRVRQKDAENTFYFLPVWDVLAYSTVWNDAEPAHFYSAYVTINAIDGSRVDRTVGY